MAGDFRNRGAGWCSTNRVRSGRPRLPARSECLDRFRESRKAWPRSDSAIAPTKSEARAFPRLRVGTYPKGILPRFARCGETSRADEGNRNITRSGHFSRDISNISCDSTDQRAIVIGLGEEIALRTARHVSTQFCPRISWDARPFSPYSPFSPEKILRSAFRFRIEHDNVGLVPASQVGSLLGMRRRDGFNAVPLQDRAQHLAIFFPIDPRSAHLALDSPRHTLRGNL